MSRLPSIIPERRPPSGRPANVFRPPAKLPVSGAAATRQAARYGSAPKIGREDAVLQLLKSLGAVGTGISQSRYYEGIRTERAERKVERAEEKAQAKQARQDTASAQAIKFSEEAGIPQFINNLTPEARNNLRDTYKSPEELHQLSLHYSKQAAWNPDRNPDTTPEARDQAAAALAPRFKLSLYGEGLRHDKASSLVTINRAATGLLDPETLADSVALIKAELAEAPFTDEERTLHFDSKILAAMASYQEKGDSAGVEALVPYLDGRSSLSAAKIRTQAAANRVKLQNIEFGIKVNEAAALPLGEQYKAYIELAKHYRETYGRDLPVGDRALLEGLKATTRKNLEREYIYTATVYATAGSDMELATDPTETVELLLAEQGGYTVAEMAAVRARALDLVRFRNANSILSRILIAGNQEQAGSAIAAAKRELEIATKLYADEPDPRRASFKSLSPTVVLDLLKKIEGLQKQWFTIDNYATLLETATTKVPPTVVNVAGVQHLASEGFVTALSQFGDARGDAGTMAVTGIPEPYRAALEVGKWEAIPIKLIEWVEARLDNSESLDDWLPAAEFAIAVKRIKPSMYLSIQNHLNPNTRARIDFLERKLNNGTLHSLGSPEYEARFKELAEAALRFEPRTWVGTIENVLYDISATDKTEAPLDVKFSTVNKYVGQLVSQPGWLTQQFGAEPVHIDHSVHAKIVATAEEAIRALVSHQLGPPSKQQIDRIWRDAVPTVLESKPGISWNGITVIGPDAPHPVSDSMSEGILNGLIQEAIDNGAIVDVTIDDLKTDYALVWLPNVPVEDPKQDGHTQGAWGLLDTSSGELLEDSAIEDDKPNHFLWTFPDNEIKRATEEEIRKRHLKSTNYLDNWYGGYM